MKIWKMRLKNSVVVSVWEYEQNKRKLLMLRSWNFKLKKKCFGIYLKICNFLTSFIVKLKFFLIKKGLFNSLF